MLSIEKTMIAKREDFNTVEPVVVLIILRVKGVDELTLYEII